MKSGSFWSWSLGVGLVALPLIGGCLRTASSPTKPVAATDVTVVETDPDIDPSAQPDAVAPQPLPQTNVEEAAVKPLPAELVLPPNVQPGKSLMDLIRLAQTGADEGVLLAFVTNSPNAFNPGADDIVYLKDIGVPESVVSAMLQRDETLKAGIPATAGAPAAPAPYAAAPTYAGPVTSPAGAPVPPPVDFVPESAPPPPVEEIYPDFYEALAPYGSWVAVEGYGYCWQPAVTGSNPGWQPYFDGGGWVYTDCGWYWRSDYTWGWAPFHYGRWFHHQHWGWCWQPDRAWGPAWVCWRHNDTHCGWAPLPPGVHFTASAGLTDHHHQVAQLSPVHFRFVEWRYFRDHNLRPHGLSPEQGNRVYNQTVVVTRFVATHGRVSNEGLAPERVAAATHTTVTRVSLRDVQPTATVGSRADRLDANGRTLSVYRPQVSPVTLRQSAAPGRAPAAKPLAISTPGATIPQSVTPHRAVNGAGSPAPTTPAAPPSVVGQRTMVTPPPSISAPFSYRAASRYYPTPGASPATRWPDNPQARMQAPKVAEPEVPHYGSPVAERPHRDLPDSTRTRVPVPAASPEAPRYSPPAAERPHHEPAPVERPHHESAPVERPRHESAPVERPVRVEPVESHASHSAPAPAAPSPAPAPSHTSAPDHSDHSDSSSHGRH